MEGVLERVEGARDVLGKLGAAATERLQLRRAPSPRPVRALCSSRARAALRRGCFAAIIPGDSAPELVVTTGIVSFLNIYNTLLVGRLILTWFPSPPVQILSPLSTLCDPYLNLFRGIIPPIGGGLDFSPILAFLTLNVFQNTAAALPAEAPAAAAGGAGAAVRLSYAEGPVSLALPAREERR
mmetsp:Transcript_18516/g.63100  ORF Transcript_18516/g.63100 Transcript_18516/m.63100 type:complete len:183 (+) Transcript_18516:74-622(+)